MFWNSEFLNVNPHEELLSQTTKLSEILYEEELLQELKTSNMIWVNFLTRPEIMKELVDNITQLTEKDCYDKLLYSRIHAAYISCEILTSGSPDIFQAFMELPNSLNQLLNCLAYEPDISQREQSIEKINESVSDAQDSEKASQKEITTDDELSKIKEHSGETDNLEKDQDNDKDTTSEKREDIEKIENSDQQQQSNYDQVEPKDDSQSTTTTQVAENEKIEQQQQKRDSHNQSPALKFATKVVPQKATLVSKLISSIHSYAPADLCCHITKNVEAFSKLIDVLVQNIHISGSFDILSTFINRTSPPESRYVFCEILAKLDFVNSLINVMTSSDVEDKQRNACQLLCDIIVHGRQGASEQLSHNGPPAQDMLAEQLESQVAVHAMLSQMFPKSKQRSQALENGITENGCGKQHSEGKQKTTVEMESIEEAYSDSTKSNEESESSPKNSDISTTQDISPTSKQINSELSVNETLNVTAIICGMKVLRCLIEWRKPQNNNLGNDAVEVHEKMVFRTMNKIQDIVEVYLGDFHNLLLNPPKQEPIKMTFGMIQKPLGYIRLEVVNLLRALISVNSPKIIMKFVELKTMKVIIDLFIDYSWNNLLHTQVEQALCSIIKICRHDEDSFLTSLWNRRLEELVIPQNPTEGNGAHLTNGQWNGNNNQIGGPSLSHESSNETLTRNELSTEAQESSEQQQGNQEGSTDPNDLESKNDQMAERRKSPPNLDLPGVFNDEKIDVPATPSIALLYQLLNDCDLIGRLLQCRNSEANYGHIIQMINSIAINRDLDTIKNHLREIETERPELFDRWRTFVDVDVASFKETSLYFDSQSPRPNLTPNWVDRSSRSTATGTLSSNNSVSLNNTHAHQNTNNILTNGNSQEDTQVITYISFTREQVLPTINVDVL